MDRVVTLSNKLRDQLAQNASIDQLLVTVQMLQSELMHKKQNQPKKDVGSAVSVHIAQVEIEPEEFKEEQIAEPEEKTVEILHVDEAELEAELEEIKRNAQAKNNMGVQNKPALLFDPVEDIPTLIHQQPITNATPETPPHIAAIKAAEILELISMEQSSFLNEKLKETKIELGDV
ncbi:MAG TPA: hypothetical protein VLR49_09270, partial [Ferruginibacter sp.]|nr:hypothetical protein [Ferruginibacter sp.]